MEKNYKTFLKEINAFVFDVDGVLTDGQLHITTDGALHRSMNTKDGFAIKHALDKGYKVAIISGGKDLGVKLRLEGLGVPEVYLGVHEKHQVFKDLEAKGFQAAHTLYMGDDIPDISVMQKVLMPCCPQDAVPEVKNVARYVSDRPGGKGCVRDVVEQVLKVKGDWF